MAEPRRRVRQGAPDVLLRMWLCEQTLGGINPQAFDELRGRRAELVLQSGCEKAVRDYETRRRRAAGDAEIGARVVLLDDDLVASFGAGDSVPRDRHG
jgi:hypothetical protein